MANVKYITYSIAGLHNNNTPIAVDCSKLESNEKAYEVYSDAHSLHGIKNVRANYSGKIKKHFIVITPERHKQYDWDNLSKEYFNKMYEPKNF